ncbi:hypothetical protein [Corallococcus sp. AS-1-6]|uniref:hypothetical protein n=1 Tax=Corallococcus sp. AS-1-6 TaxID=2874599 RepID=UPI001CC095C2|nr:hypothetical protein [Corallococcus sp. AS-1-6]MBZ4372930.1 hypothetical protein [Corallococcus sp. AS-1-6]
METLAGLPGLGILVEKIPINAGVTRADVVVMAELALRRAGIRVLTDEEVVKSVASAYLHIAVDVGALGRPTDLRLYNGKRAYGVVTWETGGQYGAVPNREIESVVRMALAPMLDRVCNDFLKANPPPLPAARPAPKRRDPEIEEVDPQSVSDSMPL